ncbi:hypothetical protein BC828DRAFT_395202 [Blastocladiella britannica]|nr:hypothetical protein BC828DRAFT_395202 [Blastocladiella britannica]
MAGSILARAMFQFGHEVVKVNPKVIKADDYTFWIAFRPYVQAATVEIIFLIALTMITVVPTYTVGFFLWENGPTLYSTGTTAAVTLGYNLVKWTAVATALSAVMLVVAAVGPVLSPIVVRPAYRGSELALQGTVALARFVAEVDYAAIFQQVGAFLLQVVAFVRWIPSSMPVDILRRILLIIVAATYVGTYHAYHKLPKGAVFVLCTSGVLLGSVHFEVHKELMPQVSMIGGGVRMVADEFGARATSYIEELGARFTATSPVENMVAVTTPSPFQELIPSASSPVEEVAAAYPIQDKMPETAVDLEVPSVVASIHVEELTAAIDVEERTTDITTHIGEPGDDIPVPVKELRAGTTICIEVLSTETTSQTEGLLVCTASQSEELTAEPAIHVKELVMSTTSNDITNAQPPTDTTSAADVLPRIELDVLLDISVLRQVWTASSPALFYAMRVMRGTAAGPNWDNLNFKALVYSSTGALLHGTPLAGATTSIPSISYVTTQTILAKMSTAFAEAGEVLTSLAVLLRDASPMMAQQAGSTAMAVAAVLLACVSVVAASVGVYEVAAKVISLVTKLPLSLLIGSAIVGISFSSVVQRGWAAVVEGTLAVSFTTLAEHGSSTAVDFNMALIAPIVAVAKAHAADVAWAGVVSAAVVLALMATHKLATSMIDALGTDVSEVDDLPDSLDHEDATDEDLTIMADDLSVNEQPEPEIVDFVLDPKFYLPDCEPVSFETFSLPAGITAQVQQPAKRAPEPEAAPTKETLCRAVVRPVLAKQLVPAVQLVAAKSLPVVDSCVVVGLSMDATPRRAAGRHPFAPRKTVTFADEHSVEVTPWYIEEPREPIWPRADVASRVEADSRKTAVVAKTAVIAEQTVVAEPLTAAEQLAAFRLHMAARMLAAAKKHVAADPLLAADPLEAVTQLVAAKLRVVVKQLAAVEKHVAAEPLMLARPLVPTKPVIATKPLAVVDSAMEVNPSMEAIPRGAAGRPCDPLKVVSVPAYTVEIKPQYISMPGEHIWPHDAAATRSAGI